MPSLGGRVALQKSLADKCHGNPEEAIDSGLQTPPSYPGRHVSEVLRIYSDQVLSLAVKVSS